LRVGLVGHRWNRLDRDRDGPVLAAILSDLFLCIETACAAPAELVTGMAEGADLTGAAALPPEWRLHGVLALPPEDWRRRLRRADRPSAEIFDRLRAFDGAAFEHALGPDPDYRWVAERVSDLSDILIAVWDGAPGKPGGTEEVVRRAARAGRPVIRVPTPLAGPVEIWRSATSAAG
jgi:hypothetical protein